MQMWRSMLWVAKGNYIIYYKLTNFVHVQLDMQYHMTFKMCTITMWKPEAKFY